MVLGCAYLRPRFISLRSLGRDDAERRQRGGSVERRGMFGYEHALHGDQQENNRRRGDQLTDAKAQIILLRSRDLGDVGHLNSPCWASPGTIPLAVSSLIDPSSNCSDARHSRNWI